MDSGVNQFFSLCIKAFLTSLSSNSDDFYQVHLVMTKTEGTLVDFGLVQELLF